MIIREYVPSDCDEIIKLFCDTVHSVNAKDYTEKQLNAWTASGKDYDRWNSSLLEHYSLVAVDGDTIVGFGDISSTGYLDRLYVHKDCQGRGIASAICDKLEQNICGMIVTHASITAKPFFEKRGYKVVKEQSVERQGVYLTNYVMEKC